MYTEILKTGVGVLFEKCTVNIFASQNYIVAYNNEYLRQSYCRKILLRNLSIFDPCSKSGEECEHRIAQVTITVNGISAFLRTIV